VRRHVCIACFSEIAVRRATDEAGVARGLKPTACLSGRRDLNRLLRLALMLVLILILILVLTLVLIGAATATATATAFAARSATAATPMSPAVSTIVVRPTIAISAVGTISAIVPVVAVVPIAILILVLILLAVGALLPRRGSAVVRSVIATAADGLIATRRGWGFR